MIERYKTEEMAALWSDETKYRNWMAVEIAVCGGWHRLGLISDEDWENIRGKSRVSGERIAELEVTTRHDVAAFVQNMQENIGPSGRYVHFGLTSSDVLDTALALTMRDSLKLIDGALKELCALLKEYAVRFRRTLAAGRTHGVHAEPTSFGLKFLLWLDDFSRHGKYLIFLESEAACGKISGAVGTYSSLDPKVEEYALASLGLSAAPVSTQIVQREIHGRYVNFLALLGCTVEKAAVELRHLQRTEVREVMEGFGRGQKGSSAMPHKKNPISAENLSGLARLLRGYAVTALENVALWHERDISHSSAERIVLADSSILIHYMLRRLTVLLENMRFDEERMRRNLEMTRGLLFSQKALLALVEKGLSRDGAYRIVQEKALRVWEDESLDFRCLLEADPQVTALLSGEELDSLFDMEAWLKHIDAVYARFGL